MTLKQLTGLPNTITIEQSSIDVRLIANREKYGKHAIKLWLKKPNDNINPSTMIIMNGWAYEVLDIISTEITATLTQTAIVIKML
jgi:hypothetical protein